MRKILLMIGLMALFSSPAFAHQGQVNVKSNNGVNATADRLENVLKDKGMTVFARIDHAAGATKIGSTLRPTVLVIFGNPKVGTPLMLCSQTIGIDLPQKALIWEDAKGQVWLTYNNPEYIARRHSMRGCGEVLKKVAGALSTFANVATAK